MSSWVAKRTQEAFALYRSYIAMGLHLKPGSEFDFSLYGPNVRLSQERFAEKGDIVKKFINISFGINHQDFDQFIFANARFGNDIARTDKRKCITTFKDWKDRFGTKIDFMRASAYIVKCHIPKTECKDHLDTVLDMIDLGEDNLIEGIIAFLHLRPDLVPIVQERIKENIFHEMFWNKMLKIRKIYYYFGIL
jgi:hypothetical protein